MSRRLEPVVAAVGFVALLAALTWEGERLADPLPDEVIVAAGLIGTLAAGALAGRWWFPAMSLAVFAAIVNADLDPIAVVFGVLFGVPITACVLAVGVAVGRRVRRRSRSSWHPAWAATALAVCATVPAAGAAYDVVRPPRDRTPSQPLTLDWRRGTFDRVALGDSTAKTIRALGQPSRRGKAEPAEPIGEDWYEIGGPTSFSHPPGGGVEVLRYRRRALFVSGARVHGWVTTSPRAQTPEGIGPGDSRELVERRYPGAKCFIANEGTEYVTFPLCEVDVCPGRFLAFGGEPIRSIWLIAETAAGRDSCRPTGR